jgi:acetyl-CoA hydrolase
VALSGALHVAAEGGERPEAPPGLLGDVCGGALYLTLGVLAGVLRARSDGQGQVVDAAMVDGAANLLNWELSNIARLAAGGSENSCNNSGKPWIRSYQCADGEWIHVEAYELQFYAELINRLGLDHDERIVQAWDNPQNWTHVAAELEVAFAAKTRAVWSDLLERTNACVVPVLTPIEAAAHQHNTSRRLYEVIDGVLQVAPAPRFSATPSVRSLRVPPLGAHTQEVLSGLGLSDDLVEKLSVMKGTK